MSTGATLEKSPDFAKQFAQQALDLGRIDYILSSIEEQPFEESPVERLYSLFNKARSNLAQQAANLSMLQASLKSSAYANSFIYKEQMPILLNAFIEIEKKLDQNFDITFNFVEDGINQKLAQTIERLGLFRSEPTERTLNEATSTLNELTEQISILSSLAERCSIDFSEGQNEHIVKISKTTKFLSTLIDSKQSTAASLLNRLAIICYNNIPPSFEEKQKLDEHILQLDTFFARMGSNFSNQLDGRVYNLSSDANKGGDSWGRLHRYDDMKNLQEALADNTFAEYENLFKDQDKGLKMDNERVLQIYTSLYDLGYGPDTAEPAIWIKKELGSLLQFLEEAYRSTEEVEEPMADDCEEISSDVASQTESPLLKNPLSCCIKALENLQLRSPNATTYQKATTKNIVEFYIKDKKLMTSLIDSLPEDLENKMNKEKCINFSNLPILIETLKKMQINLISSNAIH